MSGGDDDLLDEGLDEAPALGQLALVQESAHVLGIGGDGVHVVLGLVFLKYISDAFEEGLAQVLAEWGKDAAEDRDEYIAENIFWVPPEARWQYLKNQTRQPNIGRLVDDAMVAIERDNPALKDVLPKDYARPALDKTRLGQVVDMVSNIKVGGAEARATDVLGYVYEYFLEQFALAEGRKGGEFYTPRSVVGLMVAMLEPYRGRGVRSLLRFCGHVRPIYGIHSPPRHGEREWWQGKGGHLHLRPGVQLHNLADGQDESGHKGHSGADRAWRQFP